MTKIVGSDSDPIKVTNAANIVDDIFSNHHAKATDSHGNTGEGWSSESRKAAEDNAVFNLNERRNRKD